jgi:hypothetical protein
MIDEFEDFFPLITSNYIHIFDGNCCGSSPKFIRRSSFFRKKCRLIKLHSIAMEIGLWKKIFNQVYL